MIGKKATIWGYKGWPKMAFFVRLAYVYSQVPGPSPSVSEKTKRRRPPLTNWKPSPQTMPNTTTPEAAASTALRKTSTSCARRQDNETHQITPTTTQTWKRNNMPVPKPKLSASLRPLFSPARLAKGKKITKTYTKRRLPAIKGQSRT